MNTPHKRAGCADHFAPVWPDFRVEDCHLRRYRQQPRRPVKPVSSWRVGGRFALCQPVNSDTREYYSFGVPVFTDWGVLPEWIL